MEECFCHMALICTVRPYDEVLDSQHFFRSWHLQNYGATFMIVTVHHDCQNQISPTVLFDSCNSALMGLGRTRSGWIRPPKNQF